MEIRVVYDGPPEDGRPEDGPLGLGNGACLHALARSLGREVEARSGPTPFEWLEYTGGSFEGRQIHCQVACSPAQPAGHSRRQVLLEAADVVVFVVDTRDQARLGRGVAHVRQTVQWLRGSRRSVPVGLIVQASAPGAGGALPLEVLRAELGELAELAEPQALCIIETDPESGLGIREAFVQAVHLATERVRAQVRARTLPIGQIRDDAAPSALWLAPPHLPDLQVAKNAIWPVVEGRGMLEEVSASGLVARPTSGGDWVATGESWRAHSFAADQFADLEEGRRALLSWASEHGRCAPLLSPRTIALADTGQGAWRLWQLVRVRPSLRAWLRESAAFDVRALYARLLAAAAALGDAHSRCAGTRLEPSVDAIGVTRLGAPYIGWMPRALTPGEPAASPSLDAAGHARGESGPQLEAVVARQLARALADELAGRCVELQRKLVVLWTGRTTWEATVTSAVAATLHGQAASGASNGASGDASGDASGAAT
ncbi:MAG: hypothetical protein IPI49_17615 [Myxococcales bacterium]|nr:hypothetical protein [Myxococcales bacterium]